MKKTLFLTIAGCFSMVAIPAALAQVQQGPSDAYLENPSYTAGLLTGYSGNVGGNFQVVSADVPAGDSVEITALGYYSASGTVADNHTLSLYGGVATAGGNLSGDNLVSVTLSAGTAVDANKFAWVTLGTPITLTSGDYYDLLVSVVSGQADGYYDPYDGGNRASITPDVSGVVTGTPFYMAQAAYSTSGYAYTYSTYLGPNMQYEIVGPNPVPEPSTMALLTGALGIAFGLRRRISKS